MIHNGIIKSIGDIVMKFIEWLTHKDTNSLIVDFAEFSKIVLPYDQMDSKDPEQMIVRLTHDNKICSCEPASKYKLTPKKTKLSLASTVAGAPMVLNASRLKYSSVAGFAACFDRYGKVDSYYFVKRANASMITMKIMDYKAYQHKRDTIIKSLDELVPLLRNDSHFVSELADKINDFVEEYKAQDEQES